MFLVYRLEICGLCFLLAAILAVYLCNAYSISRFSLTADTAAENGTGRRSSEASASEFSGRWRTAQLCMALDPGTSFSVGARRVIIVLVRAPEQISPMNILLIATYELGHQPFGLASPAAWLRSAGAKVACLDISREPLDEAAVEAADLIAIHVPMHTATRLAVELIAPIRAINARAHLCFYGLYAPVNAEYLRKRGAQTILGGEFEEGLA